jgi:hypothetical protein
MLNSILSFTYKEEIFRKYKWYSYIKIFLVPPSYGTAKFSSIKI